MSKALEVANQALSKIDTHLAVCEERHKKIAENQEEAKKDRKSMHDQNQASLRRIYGLLWKLAIGTIFLLVGFIWQLLTKGKLP